MGIVDCPLLVADEPGAWEINKGELMSDAIETALGKPGSPMRVIYIGTLAPALPGGWWPKLVDGGSKGSTYVQALQGDPDKWDSWAEIRRCNPLVEVSADFRRKLLEERDDARADSRLRARFLSYRLNRPSADEATMLLEAQDWQNVLRRPVAAREGAPIVGVDLGGGRAWSAALALYRTGRLESVAICPGIPDIQAQEKRDRVPGGTYARLLESGSLMLSEGLRVPPPSQLIDAVRQRWGIPDVIFCDRFRIAELRDCNPPCQVVPRATRWSEASADIRALRKFAKDGPLSCEVGSRGLITASLSVAMVKCDDGSNVRLVKSDGANNTARDDVAAALLLAAGALDRIPKMPSKGIVATF